LHDDRGRRGEVRNATGACLSVAAVVGDEMRGESWWAQVFAAVCGGRLAAAAEQSRRGGVGGIIGSGWCRRMEVYYNK
jgi:hypothetical protein